MRERTWSWIRYLLIPIMFGLLGGQLARALADAGGECIFYPPGVAGDGTVSPDSLPWDFPAGDWFRRDGTALTVGWEDTGQLALSDNVSILSKDVDVGTVVYRVNNEANSGLGVGTLANSISIFDSGTEKIRIKDTGVTITGAGALLIPGLTGGVGLGTTGNTWDDTYTDDLFLQQTTAGEAEIHWEGNAGDDTWKFAISNATGEYDELLFSGPASPASGASVDSVRITTAGIRIEQDGGKIEFGGTTSHLLFDSATQQLRFNGQSTQYIDLNDTSSAAVKVNYLMANTGLLPDTDGGATIGTAGLSFGNLFIGNLGSIVYEAPASLTVATAAITVTQQWHRVGGEGGVADTLSTINGGTGGQELMLQMSAGLGTITVDEAGNIFVPGASIVLDTPEDKLHLIHDGTNWNTLSFSDNN